MLMLIGSRIKLILFAEEDISNSDSYFVGNETTTNFMVCLRRDKDKKNLEDTLIFSILSSFATASNK